MRVIILRTRGAGEVEHVLDLPNVEGLADIFLDELESRFAAEMSKVRRASGEQVVDNYHIPAIGKQAVSEMRSEKTGAASDQSASLAHAFLPFFRTAAGTPSGCEAARPTL